MQTLVRNIMFMGWKTHIIKISFLSKLIGKFNTISIKIPAIFFFFWYLKTSRNSVDFILGGSKIIADGDGSHEIKRRLLLGRKVMTNLDSTLKIRDITLPTKVRLVKTMVFPVVMYGCESWTVKKAER